MRDLKHLIYFEDLLQNADNELVEKAKAEGIVATDDTALAEACGIPVHLITCSYGNIKITTPEDVALAEFIISQRS